MGTVLNRRETNESCTDPWDVHFAAPEGTRSFTFLINV